MFTLKAPAKINWSLEVFGKRADGYHDILSLMQCVTLSDSLVFEPCDTLEVITSALIPPAGNLVYRAMELLKERTGIGKGARITLEKQIPMAAGLGGGSSDAASALKGLNRLWGLGLTAQELQQTGEALGSDVPFFLYGDAAVVQGRGEAVSPVRLERSHALLLVNPRVEVSTTWAYAEREKEPFRAVLTKKDNNIKLLCQALERGDFPVVSSVRKNDLETLVARRYPVITEIKEILRGRGALFSAMSGSGPTVYGVFPAEEDAQKAIEHLLPHWCRVARTVTSDA